jgi:hypothetical protein
MKINLTKLLVVMKYTGDYGQTNWIGNPPPSTAEDSPYSFVIEDELERFREKK